MTPAEWGLTIILAMHAIWLTGLSHELRGMRRALTKLSIRVMLPNSDPHKEEP